MYAVDSMPLIIEGDQGITCAAVQADQSGTDQDHAPCMPMLLLLHALSGHILRLCASVCPDTEPALKRCHAVSNHQMAEAVLLLTQSHSSHAHQAAQ